MNTQLHLQRVADVSSFDKDEWDDVTRHCGLFHSHSWMSANQHSLGTVPKFVGAYESQELVGVVSFMEVNEDSYRFFVPSMLLEELLGRAARSLRRPEINELASHLRRSIDARALVCAVPNAYVNPLAAWPRSSLQRIIDWGESFAQDCGLPNIAYLHLPEADGPLNTLLNDRGYTVVRLDADYVLKVKPEWSALEDYFAVCHHRTKELRRERNAFLRSGVSVVWHDSPSKPVLDSLAPLEVQFLREKGHEDTVEEIRSLYNKYHTAIGKSLIAVTAHRVNEEPVASCLFFRDSDVLYAKRYGQREECSECEFAYFNLVYYESVKYALRNEIKMIRFGPSTESAKTRRGAEPEFFTGAFKIPALDKCYWNKVEDALIRRHNETERR